MKLIFFSDLDGTLLDHATYDYSPALPALRALKDRGIPLVLASSKTSAEISTLRSALDLDEWPAIVENGAGELLPHASADEDFSQYRKLRELLGKIPASLRQHYRGFGDMQDQEVATITGLELDSARRAKLRAYTEPGIFSGTKSEKVTFITALQNLGISAKDGGRFLTLSFGRTKADGLASIARRYNAQKTIALGDAPNDHDMLLAATTAIVVRNDHAPTMPDIPGAMHTEHPGPIGWNEAVLAVLDSSA